MKTILIIEDDKTLRENTCDLLKEEGYDVLLAEDGLIGLQLAMNHLPDLILCDIMMPRMNGYDFYKTIQQIKATSTIPLIFLTAKAEKEDMRTGMQLGADDYITKPFDYNELLISIKTRLDKFEKIQQRNDEKFYALIDNPLTGAFIYCKNKFEFVNDACSKIFGLTREDLLTLTFEKLVTGSDKDYALEKIQRCLNKIQNTVHVKFQSFHKDNKKISVELYAGMVNYKGSDSLIGNMAECNNTKNKSVFSDEKDISAESLSKKEIKILSMVCQGLSNAEISQQLERSKRTIETHRANLLNKTGVKNTADLVMYAIRNNLI
ncbi:MAG: response regulator [Bacteroidota bacterium]